jgi:hypothetical protein
MTGADIITAIRTATLLPTSQVSDAEMIAWINEGYNRIATHRNWQWLEAAGHLHITPATASHALSTIAAGCRRIVALYDETNDFRLRQWSPALAMDTFGADPIPPQASTITEPIIATNATSMTLADASIYSDWVGYSPTTTRPICLKFTLDGEIVKCTNFAGEVATIERGQYGTTAATHLDNAAVVYAPTPTASRASGFFVWGSSIFLVPVPSTAAICRVLYHKCPTEITTATSPEFDLMFHGALTHYGEFRAWQREEDLDKAQAAYSHFDDMLGRMVTWYASMVDDHPWYVGVPQYSGGWTNTPFLDGA